MNILLIYAVKPRSPAFARVAMSTMMKIKIARWRLHRNPAGAMLGYSLARLDAEAFNELLGPVLSAD
jgi:hypothetical protein